VKHSKPHSALKRRSLFLQSWGSVLVRGLAAMLLVSLVFALLAEWVLWPSPPYRLELLDSRRLNPYGSLVDYDGDGYRDLLIPTSEPTYGASLCIAFAPSHRRRGDSQIYLPAERITGKSSVVYTRSGRRILGTTIRSDSLARLGLLVFEPDPDVRPRWIDLLVSPLTDSMATRLEFAVAASLTLAADSERVLVPVFGNFDGWRGAIVADPLQPDSLKLYPNGLGIQRFIGPFEGPEGRPWYVGGRAAANNRVSLGGFDDSHARLHGFDPDSGYTTCLPFPDYKIVMYERVPGSPWVVAAAFSVYDTNQEPGPDLMVWDPVQDTLLYSARLDLGASRMLLQPDRLLVASEQGRVLAFDATHPAPRTVGQLPIQDSNNLLPMGDGWVLIHPDGELLLMSDTGRVLARQSGFQRSTGLLEQGTRLVPGSVLLLKGQVGPNEVIASRHSLVTIPFLARAWANALAPWGLAVSLLVFLLLMVQRLGLQETLLRRVIQPGSRAVGILDRRGYLVYENPPFARALAEGDTAQRVRDLADQAGEHSLRIELATGRQLWHRRELHDRKGYTAWVLLEGQDVSLERENEQQRLFLMKLAVMAHDLKSPLTPIRLQAEGIEDALPHLPEAVAERVRQALGEIDRQVERSLQLITRFMGMARTDFELSPVSLPDIARAAIAELESLGWPALETHLEFDTERSLVAVAEGDVLQLALLELLQNSAQSLEGRGRITLWITRQGTHCLLSVQDTGPGIPADDLERVLEPGYTTRRRGTGFGLYFVRRVMERMEAGLELANRDSGGLEARLVLRAAAGQAP
jgi:signal transduction histidine kinase